MDPDDFLILGVIWDIIDSVFIHRRRTVFIYLIIILNWVTVIGAIVLFETGTFQQAALVGVGIVVTIGILLFNRKIAPKRYP